MKNRIPKRRYTVDNLVYESFYVALRNSLIIAVAPVLLFLFLAAVEKYPMNDDFLQTIFMLTQTTFIISFFVNFLYYVYFIKLRKVYAVSITVLISCWLAFTIFCSDYADTLSNVHQALILICWFLLLALIILFNKVTAGRDHETRYDHESWLYRHELASSRSEEEEELDPEDLYTHRYVEDPDDRDDDEDEDDLSSRN